MGPIRNMDIYFFAKDNVTTQFVSSSVAGFVGALVTAPADVVKSRVINQPVDENGKG